MDTDERSARVERLSVDHQDPLPSQCIMHSLSKARQLHIVGARHVLTLLANGSSGGRIARHAVFPLFCVPSLAMWNEK